MIEPAIYVHRDEVSHPVEKLYGYLTAEERAKASKFKVTSAKRMFVLGRAILRNRLRQHPDLETDAFSLQYSPQGKPFLAQHPYHISISHSPPFVAVAISPYQIGVDIEWLDRRIKRGYPLKFFSKEELKGWEALDAAAQKARFFDLWTLKEAWWKALDLPHEVAVNQFTFSWQAQPSITLTHPTQAAPGSDWNFGWHQLDQAGLLAWSHAGEKLAFPHLIRWEDLA